MIPGQKIRVEGEWGQFIILGVRKNGDLDVWGGPGGVQGIHRTVGRAQYRTFRSDRCRLVTRTVNVPGVCRVCGEEFTPPKRRGRPPVKCEECR